MGEPTGDRLDSCLTSQMLYRLVEESAPAGDQERAIRHLEKCAACRRRLEEMFEPPKDLKTLRQAWSAVCEKQPDPGQPPTSAPRRPVDEVE